MSLTAAAVALMLSTAAPQAATSAPIDTAGTAQDTSQAAEQVAGQDAGAVPVHADTVPVVDLPPVAWPSASFPTAATPAPKSPEQTLPTLPAQPVEETFALPAMPATDGEQASGSPDATTQGPDIIVTHRRRTPGDPLQSINVQSFQAVQAVDQAVIEPVAKAYNKGLPRPVRKGLRNFFSNLNEPVVFIAYLLELKPGKAAETAGRFLINTTLGVGGVMDVAKNKPFNLPYRPNGLSNVLGYYGVGPGPFFYLPIIGPTTLRDIIGDSVDNLVMPAILGKPFINPEVAIPVTVLNQLGERAAFDETIGKIRKADDPYVTYRDLYLRQRQAEIDALHGKVTPDVVPVYGRSMRTAGGKQGDKDSTETQVTPTVQEPAQAPTPAAPESSPVAEAGSPAVSTPVPAATVPAGNEVPADQPR